MNIIKFYDPKTGKTIRVPTSCCRQSVDRRHCVTPRQAYIHAAKQGWQHHRLKHLHK